MEVKKKIKKIWRELKENRRLQLGILIGTLILVALLIWVLVYITVKNQQVEDDFLSIQATLPEIEDDTYVDPNAIVPRALDGMMVSAKEANQWPVAIMIENAAFGGVRPQSGISRALVVYEIIVEGGITRWMAIFAGEDVDEIGPVRSARDTYLEFASELHAVYGHAGGSFTALNAIDSFSEVVDFDALSGDGRFFWRNSKLAAPHNLFTSTNYLDLMLRDKELLDKKAEFESWKFKDLEDNPEDIIDYIKVDFSAPSYLVEWKYNEEGQYYERWNGGELHHDPATEDTYTAKNIIVQVVPPGWQIEGKGRINFAVTGEGPGYIFNNGKVQEVTWKKPDRASRTKYYDEHDEEIELVRGNIWVEILPDDRPLEYE